MFSSISFAPLFSILRTMVNSPQINFYLWCKVGVEVHFFPIWISNSSTICWKYLFCPLSCFVTFIEKQLAKCRVYSWILFYSFDLLIYPYQCCTVLITVVNLEIGSISATFLLFFKILQAILSPLHFYITLKITLFIFIKKLLGLWIINFFGKN